MVTRGEPSIDRSYVQLWCFEVCVCVCLGISWHFVPWNKCLRAVKRLMLALAGTTRVEYRSQNPTWRLGETIIFSRSPTMKWPYW